MLKKYEVMFILDQDTQDIKALSSKMTDILKKGGNIIEQNELGLVDFAYEINHKKKGHYFVVIVEATAEAIKEFERITNIEKNVIRKLVISVDTEHHYEQSVVFSKTDMSKYEEDRKPRRDFKKPFVRRTDADGNPIPYNHDSERKPFVKKLDADGKPIPYVRRPRLEDAVVSHEEAHEFANKMQTKYKAHLSETVNPDEDHKSNSEHAKLKPIDRAKLDGSHNIEEERYELQKYSNKLRSIAIENKLNKKLQDVDLRDMTKKELVEYMRKVTASIAKK